MIYLHRFFTSSGCILAGAVSLAILAIIMAGEGNLPPWRYGGYEGNLRLVWEDYQDRRWDQWACLTWNL